LAATDLSRRGVAGQSVEAKHDVKRRGQVAAQLVTAAKGGDRVVVQQRRPGVERAALDVGKQHLDVVVDVFEPVVVARPEVCQPAAAVGAGAGQVEIDNG